MQWLGGGKATVTTAGTPVPLKTSKYMCNTIMFTFDPNDSTATIFIKDASGAIMGALSTSGGTQPLVFGGPGDNSTDASKFQVDSSANGKGPYVAYGIV